MTLLSSIEMAAYADYYKDIGIEQQIKVNHAHCSAGIDRKERLYIKKVNHGVLFYCQHCSHKGFLRTSDVGRIIVEDVPYSDTDAMVDEELLSIDPKWWPSYAKLWWYSYEMNDDDAKQLRVSYVQKRDRLLLPIDDLLHYGSVCNQYRAFNDNKPKYITVGRRKDAVYGFEYDKSNELYAVVEDIVSGMKMYTAGWNVIVLMGTSMNDNVAKYLLTYCKKMLLWLDADEAGQRGTMKILNEYDALLRIKTPTTSMQPKEISLVTLIEMKEYHVRH